MGVPAIDASWSGGLFFIALNCKDSVDWLCDLALMCISFLRSLLATDSVNFFALLSKCSFFVLPPYAAGMKSLQ